MLSSPKTTIAGIGAALAAIGTALSDGFDPSTDVGVIATAVAVLLIGLFSRDDKKD